MTAELSPPDGVDAGGAFPAPDPATARFGDLDIRFDRRVLEPRPWTLLQAEWAAALATATPPGAILELCAGAGQIGIAAARLTGRALVQIDADPVACGYARANAGAAGIGDRVEVRCQPLEAGVEHDERFAIVIADPPYIPSAEIDRFAHDPASAIDGGPDGLAVVRACLTVLDDVLARGGPALLQLRGRAQVDALAGSLPPHRAIVEIREDGPERAVVLLREIDPATGHKVAPIEPVRDERRQG